MTSVCPIARLSSWTTTIAFLFFATLLTSTSPADQDAWLDPDGLPGTLAIVGGGKIPEDVADVLKAGLSDNGTIVVIPEASSDRENAVKSAVQWFEDHGISSAETVDLSLPEEDRRLKTEAAIDSAAAVWICGGQQSQLASAYAGSGVEAALLRLLQRGGVVAGTSAGAAIMSKVMIASGQEEPQIAQGWNLLPDAIVDQHFSERNRLGRSQIAVEMHPECFGLGIDEGTAVIVSGRRMRVVGPGAAFVLLAKTEYRDSELMRLAKGTPADLTQLRRAARQRATRIDPGLPKSGAPNVPAGSLVIVGGGAMPEDVVNRFVELAGGEVAKIVVLPTAVPREEATEQAPGFLKRGKVGSISVLTQRGPGEVASEEFQTAIRSATGVWFGGGRQWNFVDSYEGTEALELFHDVLRRGGVIGGSSAGATIQGEFLVRGHPLGNTVMMAEGYERGFSFLPGTAIDQHFTQRGRLPDLLPVVQRHPRMLGIGIDEGTAIVVTGTKVEVIGQHSAHFVSRKQLSGTPGDQPLPARVDEAAKLYVSVKSGESVDLRQFSE